MLEETTRSLQDPSGKILYDAWKATVEREKAGKKSTQFADSGVASEILADTRIGSGSDHTVFLNFIGMPVIGLGFEGDYGVYHSAYDDFYWMNHFGDPGYKYHTLMSQLWGVTALRLANADLLPFDFASYAANIRQFVNELAKANENSLLGQPSPAHPNHDVILNGADAKRSEAAAASKDSTKAGATRAPSTNESNSLSLNGLQQAIDNFEVAGRKLNQSLGKQLTAGEINPQLAATLNRGMMQVERNWLNPDGIPGRPWFKHILYGARFTYAHLELPGLTEAVEKQDWPTAKQQAEILQRALEKNTELVNQLDRSLNGSLSSTK